MAPTCGSFNTMAQYGATIAFLCWFRVQWDSCDVFMRILGLIHIYIILQLVGKRIKNICKIHCTFVNISQYIYVCIVINSQTYFQRAVEIYEIIMKEKKEANYIQRGLRSGYETQNRKREAKNVTRTDSEEDGRHLQLWRW